MPGVAFQLEDAATSASSKFESEEDQTNDLRTSKSSPSAFSRMLTKRTSFASRVIQANNRTATYAVLAIILAIAISFSASIVVIVTRPTHVDHQLLLTQDGKSVATSPALANTPLVLLPQLGQYISYGALKGVSLQVDGATFGASVTGYSWSNNSFMLLYLTTGHVLTINGTTLALSAPDGSTQTVQENSASTSPSRRQLQLYPMYQNLFPPPRPAPVSVSAFNGGASFGISAPTPSEKNGWKGQVECKVCSWIATKLKDKIEGKANEEISRGLCDAIKPEFDDAIDGLCAPFVDPLLAPLCGWAAGKIFGWACGKVLDWALEKDEEELEEWLKLTPGCICYKMGLCPEDKCPSDDPKPPEEPPRDWWDCPPAPPEYCDPPAPKCLSEGPFPTLECMLAPRY